MEINLYHNLYHRLKINCFAKTVKLNVQYLEIKTNLKFVTVCNTGQKVKSDSSFYFYIFISVSAMLSFMKKHLICIQIKHTYAFT